jgi:cell division septation protein DedD
MNTYLRNGLIGLAAILALGVVVSPFIEDEAETAPLPAASQPDYKPATAPEAPASEDFEVTPAMVVDFTEAQNPVSLAEACSQINSGLLTYDQALDSFMTGYGYGQEPSGEAVFAEMVSRC